MNNKEELTKNWLIKSKRDLFAAQKLSQEEDLYGDISIYHCQQSAEKAVKGFVTFHDQEFPKTHDVRLLVQLAISIDSSFENYQETAEILTPYATEFRYPSDLMEPTHADLEEALQITEQFFVFVVSCLSDAIGNAL